MLNETSFAEKTGENTDEQLRVELMSVFNDQPIVDYLLESRLGVQSRKFKVLVVERVMAGKGLVKGS